MLCPYHCFHTIARVFCRVSDFPHCVYILFRLLSENGVVGGGVWNVQLWKAVVLLN